MRRRVLLAVAVGAAVFGIATAVQASIPDANGVIHACYNTSLAHGNPTGALRVIDTSAPNGRCASWEAPLTWSQRGTTGATGATGSTGPSGPSGARGPTGPGFGDLAFDAASMWTSTTSDPDAIFALGESVAAWTLAEPPETRTISLDVPVPLDFVDSPTETLVSVDFISQSSPVFPPPSGNVTIELQAADVPVGASLLGVPATYVQVVTGVSGADVTHYRATFALPLQISPGDSLLLGVTRSAVGDTFPVPVFLTGVSFRYEQS